MSLISSLFATLRAELDWLITALAVAPATIDAATGDDGAADSSATAAHHSDSAPAIVTAILSLTGQQACNTSADHEADASPSDSRDFSAIDGANDIVRSHFDSANMLQTADFVVDDAGDSDPTTTLIQVSLVPGYTDFDSSSTPWPANAGEPEVQYLSNNYSSPTEAQTSSHIAPPDSSAGDFALASLLPQIHGDFAHGTSVSKPVPGGSTAPAPYTSTNGNFTLVIDFDSSVSKAPGTDANGFGFVVDVEKVADFFTANFTTLNKETITIDVGYGEVGGSALGGALGESDTYYVTAPGSKASNQYNSLVNAFTNLQTHENTPVNIPGSDPLGTASQQWWLTTAEGKALGVYSGGGVDGWIGVSSGAGTFFYNPTSPVTGEYDFMGTVAHEISEVMGRATLNGEKYPGDRLPEYMPLDLFHFSDSAPGTHIYSGAAKGYFATSSSGAELQQFNTSSSGDFSDWATPDTPADSFDWSGGQGVQSAVSWPDYLAMEAVGWIGISSATSASGWTLFG